MTETDRDGDAYERIERVYSQRRCVEPVSYEVTASRLKPGCAEGAIVNGFLELIGPR